ncbi:hypothetical protein LUD75_05610 [Epilithonimonas sp. JDS]|uniref:hypothetical protein n=1 Tax=Epilithonimonas sp. JDS TaxID=2902797 RepID=UPI001E4E7091|nr:hypothetical protein [Epilithonimonas sp. JDS]MCD9854169.1 hypothetical protein [Epilithonimonas sp. JDS]
MKLLYINKNINLSKPIVSQLINMGFEVDVLIDSLPPMIDNSSLVHRIKNIFYRLVLKDKTYFIKKEKQVFEKFAEKRLQNKKYDIAFFIRADMYSEKLISRIRKQSKKMICYQWDGLEMYPRIFEYFKYFDRKLVFDANDISKFPQYDLLPITNFYYSENVYDSRKVLDFFYVGVGLDERIKWAYNIENFAKKHQLTFKAILTVPEFRDEVKTESVSLQHRAISLEQNEKYASTAKAIIDFKMESHNGASFRVFECLQKEKKLVSNNYNLRKYDFYHPDNIFLTDFEDLNGLEEFLQKPYHKIDRKIVEKYGIKNWLNYALDYGNYEPINLP